MARLMICLGTTAAALLLTACGPPVHPAQGLDFRLLGTDASAVYFVDRAGRKTEGGLVKLTVYMAMSPGAEATDKVASAEVGQQVDCARSRMRILSVQEFTAGGRRASVFGSSNPPWQAFAEQGMGGEVYRFACTPDMGQAMKAVTDYRAWGRTYFASPKAR